MAYLNGYYITVESEEPDFEVDITEQPVENGMNMTDHVQRKASSMNISGVILGEDAAQIRKVFQGFMDSGTVVEFDGRNYFTGLIQSLSTKHDYTVSDGYTFSMSLKEIGIAESSYIGSLPAPIRAEAAPIVSSGTKQTKSAKGKTDEKVEKVTFKAGSPWATT
ncbi:phage baseplate protein [Paenibacillus sp. SI8]|uniref:phage baseplate protein n=1 Tax=unclassified Paenibacillus TaxID=185978 RepID=UPI003465D791